MSNIEGIKEKYLAETRKLLHDHPAELLTFEGLWRAGQYRMAFLAVEDAVRNLGLVRTEACSRADLEFYGYFVQ